MLKDVAVQKNEIDGIRQSSHPDIKAPLGSTTDCIEGPHSLKGNLDALQNENCLGDCFENCPETCPEMVITTCMDNLAVSTCPEISHKNSKLSLKFQNTCTHLSSSLPR